MASSSLSSRTRLAASLLLPSVSCCARFLWPRLPITPNTLSRVPGRTVWWVFCVLFLRVFHADHNHSQENMLSYKQLIVTRKQLMITAFPAPKLCDYGYAGDVSFVF